MLNDPSPKTQKRQTCFCSHWQTGFQTAAASRLWRYCLLAIGSASSFIYPHAPLVSFAAIAGLTLKRRQAVGSAVLIWLVNQLYGFTVRHYPLSTIALLWGVTMGLGTIVVVLIASMQPRFSHRSWVGQSVWLGMAILLGFAVYQSSFLLVNQWVGMHGLTADVFLRMLGRDVLWAIALFALHTVLVVRESSGATGTGSRDLQDRALNPATPLTPKE